MRELRTIGDYEVKAIGRDGALVRYEATHIMLPRIAIIELVDPAGSLSISRELLRRACILEALRHPNVPRVFECGRLDGQPWVAFEHCDGITLEDELRRRHLEVGEVLDLLEQVGALLSHAHARGVLHRDITTRAIIRNPELVVTCWDHACAHDTNVHTDGRDDVFALAHVALAALHEQHSVPVALARLLAKMLAPDVTKRPTASQVVANAQAIREPGLFAHVAGASRDAELDAALESLTGQGSDEVEIEYVSGDRDEEEPVLLESRRRTPRWTPGWNAAQRAAHERNVVEIRPRAKRMA